MDDSLQNLERMFSSARTRALSHANNYNAQLPSAQCPRCKDPGHVPGLRCTNCAYRHPQTWAIIRDTEWGYQVVPLTNRKIVLAEFNVDAE